MPTVAEVAGEPLMVGARLPLCTTTEKAGSAVLTLVASTLSLVVGLIAIVLATINMVGGFVVTDRMLQMFTRKKKPAPSAEKGAGA